MAKINLPKETLEKDAFKTLPAKEKEEYLKNVLKKILDLNPGGITTSQIKDAIGLPSSTIWHHLEILKSNAQGRKISRGNMDIYYPFGKINHLKDYTKGNATYSLCTAENNEGNFVCIYEKRENRSGNYTVLRGTAIPVELIDSFVKTLNKAKK